MDVSLYQAAAAMNASSRWQETISDNLAASQIPGYKRQDLSFSSVQSGFMARSASASPAGMQRFVMPQAGTNTNFRAGELRPTGVPTDLAIEGKGFFEVQLPDGKRGFTRDGEFQLNGQGQLVTKQGLLVMSETGPLQFDPNNSSPISISAAGDVAQGGVPKGKLKVMEFSDPTALTATGTGLFLANDPAVQPQPAQASLVRQGFIESSNTSTVMEMSNLITAMRHYEANQKVAQMEDDRVGRLISDVANAS